MKRIYISDEVHKLLKEESYREGRTIQWLVENKLLSKTPPSPKNTSPYNLQTDEVSSSVRPEKIAVEPSATRVDDLFNMPEPVADDHLAAGEFACCLNETRPCKHWVWDTNSGEGYKNSLSGRFKEAE